MDWCRLWHEMPNDPKWRVIARKSGQQIGNVIAVYTHMMVCASQADERGTIDGWDDEDVAAALDMDPEAVHAIREAMQGKTLDGDSLKGWDRRQPKRERDDDSSERVRKFRKSKQKQEDEGGVTAADEPCNATKRHVTPRNAQIRGEEIREDKKGSVSNETGDPPPDPVKVVFDAGIQLLTNGGQSEKSARGLIGKWRKQYGDEGVIAVLGQAQRAGATEPVSFIQGILKAKPVRGSPEGWAASHGLRDVTA